MHIFLFHRDLRIYDNTSLIALFTHLKAVKHRITPVFIFPPEQISPKLNKYFSHNSVQFMIQSLKDLNQQMIDHQHNKGTNCMHYFVGRNIEVLSEIHEKIGIESIGYNIDYTPFAKARDEEINSWGKSHQIDIIAK